MQKHKAPLHLMHEPPRSRLVHSPSKKLRTAAEAAAQRETTGVVKQEDTALRASSRAAVKSVKWDVEIPQPISAAVEAPGDAMDGEVR